MAAKVQLNDGMENYAANLGTSRDKAAYSGFVQTFWPEPQLLVNYRESWAAAKIVDIPARDATRAWRSWQAKKDQIDKIERLERIHGVQLKVEQALILARLYGGAAIYIGTNQSSDPSKPLRDNEQIRYLRVLTKTQLKAGLIDLDLESEYFGQPAYYQLVSQDTFLDIHPSRLVRFVGKRVPDAGIAMGFDNGWGDSVLASCMTAVLRAESTMANANSLVFESKVDVLGIPDLAQSFNDNPDYEKLLLKRASVSALAKGINGMLLIDAAETYESKSASFSGLHELIEKFLQEIAGASDIPVTRLLGQSPSGLNSTGESDLRNYYDRVNADQNLTIGPAMALLDNLLIRNALGGRPEEIHYTWNSLWQATATEQANIGKTTAETIKILQDTALFNSDALSAASVNLLTERGVMPGLEGAMEQAIAQGVQENDPEGSEVNS